MPICARTIGGPGAGKTRRGLQIVDLCISKRGLSPLQIGYVSFTRSARREASDRAADHFSLKGADLEKVGWFRTLHSVAYRCLGVQKGELLAGSKADDEWLRNALNDEKVRLSASGEDDDYFHSPTELSDSGRALALWDVARNRQVPLECVWEAQAAFDERLPPLDSVLESVSLYEVAKGRDGRIDFCDLLMRFAGFRFSGNHLTPFEACRPDGEVPRLPVWLHDEMNDCSALTAAVFRRLIEPSQWVYLLGDAWQAIYQWCGADPAIFMGWEVEREEELPESHRCRQEILDLGYSLIRDQAGSSPRAAFRSAKGGGAEIEHRHVEEALASLRPGDDVLVLARTNQFARRCAQFLDDALCPWRPVKGGGGFVAPARAAGVAALVTLRSGGAIDGEGYFRLLELLPARAGGVPLFVRGTKSFYGEKENRQRMRPTDLAGLRGGEGAEQAFCDLLASGRYKELLEPPAVRMAAAAELHGVEAIKEPTIKVGTCHSAKGLGADHVVALNCVPWPSQKAMETDAGMAEEKKLWYTTVTRARDRLTLAEAGGETFPGL